MYIDEDMFILERQSYHLACSILLQRKRFSANVTDDDKSKLDLATPKLFIRPKKVQIYYYFNSLLHIKFIVMSYRWKKLLKLLWKPAAGFMVHKKE